METDPSNNNNNSKIRNREGKEERGRIEEEGARKANQIRKIQSPIPINKEKGRNRYR